MQRLCLCSTPVALLVGLSLTETVLAAQIGKVTGGFYSALLDNRDEKRFLLVLAKAAAWFAAAGLVKACGKCLSEQLELGWRRSVTDHLQQQCGHRNGYLWLRHACDNLDQRLLQDVQGLCHSLGQILPVMAAAPFKVVFYSVWVAELTSRTSLAGLYAFFLFGAAVQRYVQPCCRLSLCCFTVHIILACLLSTLEAARRCTSCIVLHGLNCAQ